MEFKIKLLNKRNEAKDTKTFIFERPGGFSYLAGQYVYLTLPRLTQPDERGDTRHFTLSSSPTEDHLAITVRMRAESAYKQSLSAYKLGTDISMRGPNGFFILDPESSSGHAATPQVMVAGGIGITPYRSIIRYIADKNLPVPIQLIYSNSIPEEIVFKAELDKITKEHGNIRVTYTITKPEESKIKWSGLVGRVDQNLIQSVIRYPTSDIRDPIFWLCGPPPMVSAMEKMLATTNIPYNQIKVEKFTGY